METQARPVVVTYLEMLSPDELNPKPLTTPGLEIRRVQHPLPEFNRFLYASVGGDWFWTDRLAWNYQRWLEWLDRPTLETWVAYVDDTPAGYFELDKQPDGAVEIAYFGLIPAFVGRGLGGQLLSVAIQRAWELYATRVWLHTCTLDHPNALDNYQARGFRVTKTVTELQQVPQQPLGPWPGAREEPN